MYYIDSETRLWPDWTGQTAVCIATGPSLTQQQVEIVKRSSVRSIGINDVGLRNQWVDIWYAADYQFWKHYSTTAETSDSLKVCAERDAIKHGLVDLFLNVNDREKALRYTPGYALHGEHSGFQALQLAISIGATKVVLVGYDCKPKGQLTNYFGTKCASLHRHSDYKNWPLHYDRLAIPDGVEVLNATTDSAITAYPKVELESVLG